MPSDTFAYMQPLLSSIMTLLIYSPLDLLCHIELLQINIVIFPTKLQHIQLINQRKVRVQMNAD